MASAYIYLISSLPMLQFGAKPQFSLEDFLEMCRSLIPEEDFAMLDFCVHDDLSGQWPQNAVLRQWQEFETGLRNEMVRIRASRKKLDPEKYLRPGGSSENALAHIAANSHRIPSLIESEKFLDRERWNKLEELCFGHYFDREELLIYCLKLRILWRWENINQADRQAELDRVLV